MKTSASSRLLILAILLLVGVQTSSAQIQVTVTGSVELLDATNHAGVEVFFEPLSPSAVPATVLSESDGFYVRTNVPVGIYNIRLAKDGYVPGLIPNVFIDADVNFDAVSLRPGGTAEIGGVLSGTLSGDTLYTVTETLTVPAGRTLTIEGGAELQFSSNTGLIADGNLIVDGTASRSVLFTSAEAVPDFSDWLGVRLRDGTMNLSHLTILFAHSPITSREFHAEGLYDGEGYVIRGSGERIRADHLVIDEVALNRISIDLPQISGISLSNVAAHARQTSVVNIQYSSRVTIDNSEFRNGRITITGDRAENVSLTNSRIIDYRHNAIRARYGREWMITENSIESQYETEHVIYAEYGADLTVDDNTIELRDEGKAGRFHLNMISISSGTISNNSISISWSGTGDSSDGEIFRIDHVGVIHNNDVIISSLRSLSTLATLYLRQGEVSANRFDIYTTRHTYSSRYGTDNVDQSFSGMISNADVYDNEFRIISDSYIGYGGIIFDRSHVRDNKFLIESNERYDGSSFGVQNSVFERNEVLISSPVYSNRADVQYAAVIAVGNSTVQNNTISGESGIYAHGLTAGGAIRNNLIITREENAFGAIATAGSAGMINNNTLVNSRHDWTGRGVRVESEATSSVLNNAIHGFGTGIYASSQTRSLMYNNVFGASQAFAGSHLPPQIGNITTTNHLGTPSDIYYNTFIDPLFVAPADTNYQLQPTSPLINAGSDDIRDPDGTRADIGAFYFDFGNPKHFQLAATGEGTASFAFDPVMRDSVEAYLVYGGNSRDALTEVASLSPDEAEFTLDGLTNNAPYYVSMRTLFTNVESIATDTLEAIPGVAKVEYDLSGLTVLVADEADSVEVVLRLSNTGSRDLIVSGAHQYFDRSEPLWSGSFQAREFDYNTGFLVDEHQDILLDVSGTYSVNKCDYDCWYDIHDAFYRVARDYEYYEGMRNPTFEPSVVVDGSMVAGSVLGFNPDHIYSIRYTGQGNTLRLGTTASQNWYYWDTHGSLTVMAYPSSTSNSVHLSVAPTDKKFIRWKFGPSDLASLGATIPIHLETNDLSAPSDTLYALLLRPDDHGLSPVYFEPAEVHGDTYPVLISNTLLDGNGLQPGDEVALFQGDTCVGAASYSGSGNLLITASGYSEGAPITFKMYHSSTGEVVDAEAVFSYGNGTFGHRNFAHVRIEATMFEQQTLTLPAGRFNLISLNVEPVNDSADQIFGSIANLEIGQDDLGRAYIPSYNVDGIGGYDYSRAYHVYRSGADSLQYSIQGRRVVKGDRPVTVFGNRFNSVPNLYRYSVDVEEAFASISDRIDILQDDAGNAWIPALGVNSINATEPGKGYQIFLTGSSDTTVVFPDLPEYAPAGKRQEVPLTPEYYVDVVETGLPYQVVITGWSDGTPEGVQEIALWSDDRLVGSAVAGDLPIVVTAWKADPQHDLPGFTPGELVRATVWLGQERGEEEIGLFDSQGEDVTFGTGAYAAVVAGLGASLGTTGNLPADYSLGDNYPNPFSTRTMIEYSVPEAQDVRIEVYNILGQRVGTVLDQNMQAGDHRVEWNGAASDGSTLSNGVYFLRMEAGSFRATRKVVLLK